jgi:hypothetical protein
MGRGVGRSDRGQRDRNAAVLDERLHFGRDADAELAAAGFIRETECLKAPEL